MTQKLQLILSVSLTIFLGSSCRTGIKFDPDFHRPCNSCGGLLNERGGVVEYYSDEIEQFSCMSKSKIKELSEILTRAKIPKKDKRELQNFVNSALVPNEYNETGTLMQSHEE